MKKLKIAIISLALLSTITLGTATHAHRLTQPAKAQDIDCLARNIYHEARSESLEGQIAVAQVTVNRVINNKRGNTVCKVVYAPSQFSWTLNKSKRISDHKAWAASVDIARAVLTQSIRLPDFTAQYYHTKKVLPTWAKNKQIVAVIGNHIFYS